MLTQCDFSSALNVNVVKFKQARVNGGSRDCGGAILLARCRRRLAASSSVTSTASAVEALLLVLEWAASGPRHFAEIPTHDAVRVPCTCSGVWRAWWPRFVQQRDAYEDELDLLPAFARAAREWLPGDSD